MRAGDVAAMPADIRHQGYSPKRSMLLVWENDSADLPELIAHGTALRSTRSTSEVSRRVHRRRCDEAVEAHVHDGDTVAFEGFTHLIPHAAGHEVIRQGRRDLTLVRMTPDVVYDQLIGCGLREEDGLLVGRQPRRRVAAPVPRCGRARLAAPARDRRAQPCRHGGSVRRPARRGCRSACSAATSAPTSSPTRTRSRPITCPFTGETLTAVQAIELDVAVIHAQQADREGNVQLWGLVGVQKEAVLAARRSIVTVEEIVDELEPRPNAVVLPSWVVSSVCLVPGGAHPSFAMGYSERDNAFYRAWDEISRDRDSFTAWIDKHVQRHRRLRRVLPQRGHRPRSDSCLSSGAPTI